MNAITKLIIYALALVVTSANAQEFSGEATYKSHRKVDLKMDDNNANAALNEQIQEQLRKQFQREYTLTFNQDESIYKQNEQLEAPAPASANGFNIVVSQSTDIMYKNAKENRYTNQTEIFGKQFLIKDTLTNRQWELVNETKNIGVYTCFKAIFKDEVTTQTVNEKGELESLKKERITSAWYTPQIPVNNGPEDFYGLPGLILEINDGDLTLVCTKIIINPKEKVEIVEPKKGKEVTQKEFDEIMEKKNKEMMERFQSQRGDGKQMMIRIGG
ncbi:MAG: GLPGLI family protein [Gelidibacter sp.]|nr:GLPGLI family protein [Gelidibacter sp.]